MAISNPSNAGALLPVSPALSRPLTITARIRKAAASLFSSSPARSDAYRPALTADAADLTAAVHQGPVISNGFSLLLHQELKRESVDASLLFDMAEQLTETIRKNVRVLAKSLSRDQRQMIAGIAADSHMTKESALIEYLANASLMRLLRDYHDLPAHDVFEKDDCKSGFIALTKNGSMVSSGPHVGSQGKRAFHYVRMPSRKNSSLSQSETRWGNLVEDIRVGECLRSTLFNTSYVTMLLYITPDKADEFDYLREWAEASVASVHQTVSHPVVR